ncbi:hypothetical protein DFJ73DRAFT_775817 [Zopfochytrium polystomum]|nr:hypothetical protein DFJ73DRAFT_775817 [Zopfochytrium polystomum]
MLVVDPPSARDANFARVFEVDSNATVSTRKACRLAALAAAPLAAQHHVFVADLAGETWGRELARRGFDDSRSTLFVVEGLMYLSAAAMLATIDRLSASENRMLGDKWGTRHFKVGLSMGGEGGEGGRSVNRRGPGAAADANLTPSQMRVGGPR